MTKFLRLACAVALVMVGLSAVAEPKGPEYAVVTCAEDGTGLGDGKITLRDAVGAMADPAFTNAAGARVITFSLGSVSNVTLNAQLDIASGTKPFAIDGLNGGRGVTVSGPSRLIRHDGDGLVLSNLTFRGGNAGSENGGAIFVSASETTTNRALTAVNCAFDGNAARSGGAVAAEAKTHLVFDRCTFFGNTGNDAGAVLAGGSLVLADTSVLSNRSGSAALSVRGEGVVAKATLAFNAGTGGALHVAGGATCGVYDSLFSFNGMDGDRLCDALNEGTLNLHGVKMLSGVTGGGSRSEGSFTTIGDEVYPLFAEFDEEGFGVYAVPRAKDGVTHVVFLPLHVSHVVEGAGCLWHDEAWTNVAFSADAFGTGKTALLGSPALCGIRAALDVCGRAPEKPARGAAQGEFHALVTFEGGGDGSRNPQPMSLPCGRAPGDGPVEPALSGLPFDGWYEEPGGAGAKWWNADGTPAIATVPSVGLVTLHASYVAKPETFVVMTGADDSSAEGSVTLRSAIAAMAAAPGWVGADGRRAITFSPAVTNISLQSTLTVPPGTRPFLIDGGPDGKVLAAVGNSRILALENEGVSLSRLVFINGRAAATAEAEAGGGAIWATNGCAVAASNCVFRGNWAAMSGGAVRLRGSGTAAFVGCTFYMNELAEGSGGAICAEGATLTLEDCSFVKNACTGAASSGGAVSGYGPLAVTRSTFYGNRAGNAGAVQTMWGSPSVRDSLFAANEPPSSGVFAELPAENLFAPPDEEICLQNMTLAHAYLRPLVSPAVTNGVVTTAPTDLLGRAPVLPGKGAVRSEFGVRLVLDLSGGSMTVTNIRFAVCGVAPPPLPVPTRAEDVFAGWWGDQGGASVQYADANGEPTGAVLPSVEELPLYARWNSSPKRFVVTTLEDTESFGEAVTLRSAIREMAASPGGDRKVTFAVSGTVQLRSALEIPVGAEKIVIDGSVQNGVTIQGGGFSGAPIFQVKGAGLDLRNLTVEGAADGVARVSSGVAFAASNCVFRSNQAEQGGVAYVEGSSAAPTSRFTRCTFKGNVSRTAGSGVAFAQSPLAFEACSFVDSGDTVFGEGPMTFDRCTLASVPGGAGVATLNDTLTFAGSDGLFVPGEQTFAVGPVTHVYRRPLSCPAVTNGLSAAYGELPDLTGRAAAADGSRLIPGRGAVHSEYGTCLGFDAGEGSVAETNLYALCGARPTEAAPVPSRFGFDFGGWYLTEDFTGEPCFDAGGQPNPAAEPLPFGSPLTLYAKWAATPALLTVTTGGDEHVKGQVNLREAVEALAKYDFADRTIRFDGVTEIRLKEQIVVPEGTAPFTIDGGASGLDIRPDPDASSCGRLILHKGLGLTLRNMTFREVWGICTDAGALVDSDGPLLAENCAFIDGRGQDCSRPAFYVESSTTVLVDCTFAGNKMGNFGAGFLVARGATAVAVHCTFCQNRSLSQIRGTVVNMGNLTLLGCSVVENEPYGVIADGDSTVLVGCAFALNPTNDVDGTAQKIAFTSSVQYDPSLTVDRILKDGNRAVAQKAVVNGVEHTYYVPAGSEEMRKGVYIWHDAAWANVAYSTELVRSAGNTTVVLGSYDGASTLKSTDQIGTPLAVPYRGAIGLVEEIGEEGLLVTTVNDVVDPTDGVLSLREALAVAEGRRIDPDLDGRYRIRFADSLFDASGRATVLFTNDVLAQVEKSDILICGRTDGRRLTLDCRSRDVNDVFAVATGGALELDDLTLLFSPKSSDSTAYFVYSYGTFTLAGCTVERSSQNPGRQMIMVAGGLSTLERCSFVGGAGANETGGGVTAADGEVRILGCTFANLNLANPGVIEKRLSGRLILANTTLVGNKVQTNHGALDIVENASGEVLVLNCLFANEGTDIFYSPSVVPPSFKLCQTVCKAVSNPLKNAMTGCTLMGSAAADAFASDLRRIFVGGVERAYRPPRLNSLADRTGGYVWRSEDWKTLVVTSNYVNRLNRMQVSGNTNDVAKAAILVGATDIVGRDVLQGINVRDIATDRQATPGSYTTTEDAEVDQPGWLTVNTMTDENTAEPDHYDGHLSLREAVDYAQRHPEWRTNGVCTVTFDPDVFKLKADQVLESRMRQIDITTFTNGTLRIGGPTDGTNSVTLSGMGKYRLFHVGAGNRVEFSNLNFTNALSQSVGACPTFAGGAIHNAGEITVSNCSFRVCRTKAQGYAYGGAIFTAPDGRLTVERCSFVGCEAGEGGAVCTDERGTTVLATSVFAGNSVTRLTTLCDGTGGAVCGRRGAAMTALVNCTVTGNAAEAGGGGVAVSGLSTEQTALYLLDSIVVGNTTDGADGSADIRVASVKARLRHAWCGGRNDTLDEVWDIDGTVKTDKVPSDIFCDITKAGAAIPQDVRGAGACQTYFRLNSETETGAAFVKTYDGWKNVGYAADSPTDVPTALYLEAPSREIQLRRSGVLRGTDQFGNEIGAKALMGATAVYENSKEPVPVVVTDPLCVSNGTFKALSDVIRYAATHTGDASLVSNGYLTVTFAEPNYTFNFDTDLTLEAFTGPKLRIVGPVTFDGKNKTRFFSVFEGNGLRLENVTMVNGVSVGTNEVNNGLGGAIYAEYATLSASNCTFRSCVAKSNSSDSPDGFGGAVMAYVSPADFTACTFEGCLAEEKVGGTCVSRMDSDATFIGCTFSGSSDETLKKEVCDPLHALVIRADPAGRYDYFSTAAEALDRCVKGDTLVLLAPDSVDVEEVGARLPRGVTLRIGGAADGAEALLADIAETANAAFVAKSEPWYTATVRETDGLVVMDVGLNDLAKPGLGEVDFDAADGTMVSVWPTDVKPGLVYGLGRSDSPTGPFVVEEDGWVQADANGALPHALTAPKGDGAGGFFRVIVRDNGAL